MRRAPLTGVEQYAFMNSITSFSIQSLNERINLWNDRPGWLLSSFCLSSKWNRTYRHFSFGQRRSIHECRKANLRKRVGGSTSPFKKSFVLNILYYCRTRLHTTHRMEPSVDIKEMAALMIEPEIIQINKKIYQEDTLIWH